MNTAVYTADFCEVNSETLWAFECPTDDNQFYLSLPSFWYLCGDDYEDAVIGYSSLRVSKALINLMDHLFSVLDRLKCSPNGNFRLSVSDVSADQAVHDLFALHVLLGIGDRLQLVIGLLKREHFFKFLLPDRLVYLPHFLKGQAHVKQGAVLRFIEKLNAYPYEKNRIGPNACNIYLI